MDPACFALETLGQAILPMLLPPKPDLPVISGPSAVALATTVMHQLQKGDLDRSKFGEEFNAFLTPEKVRSAAASLGPLGDPKSVEIADVAERGGMEEATVRFRFAEETIETLMYRSPNGLIQEFLVYRR